MSAETPSINPAAFAEALTELPLSALYSKVSELRNSIAHLHRSNSELRLFLEESKDTEEEKKEMEGYIVENQGVIASMEERILLLKTELENRGKSFEPEEGEGKHGGDTNGEGAAEGAAGGGEAGEALDRPEEPGVYL